MSVDAAAILLGTEQRLVEVERAGRDPGHRMRLRTSRHIDGCP